MTIVLIRTGEDYRDTHKKECHVKMKADIGVIS